MYISLLYRIFERLFKITADKIPECAFKIETGIPKCRHSVVRILYMGLQEKFFLELPQMQTLSCAQLCSVVRILYIGLQEKFFLEKRIKELARLHGPP